MVYEDIKLEGHIIDSMVLPRVLDDILDLGGDFRFLNFRVGREKFDHSRAVIRVQAADEGQLELILSRLQRHGAQAVEQVDAEPLAILGQHTVDLLGDFRRDYQVAQSNPRE